MSTLNLHTGLPGASKTLYTIAHVLKLVETEQREAEKAGKPYECQVYYHNIRGCKVPGWIELEEPRKWYELPTGSIIIIDEAQDHFRPRGTGTAVPEHVAQLEKHRHRGYRIFLITQHPMLIDNNVRRLVTKHRHMVRAFGKHFATVHSWDKCKENCDKHRDDSEKESFPYPKEVFSLYQSAELHTVKGRIPWRLAFLAFVPLLLILFGYWLYTWWAPRLDESKLKDKIGHGAQMAMGSAPQPMAAPQPVSYMQAQQARVPGLPHTAPAYDGVTQAVTAPYPAACVQSKSRGCVCYSQQGTLLDTPEELCAGIVKRGFFVAWDTNKGSGSAPGRPQVSQEQTQALPQPVALDGPPPTENLPGVVRGGIPDPDPTHAKRKLGS